MKEKWAPINQINSEKHSIAWFKLAECVSRHERERALGVLRLLVHSFDDQALAYQLAGDLFLSFDEVDEAIKRYDLAAQWYQKEKRMFEATGVYEHLATLSPNSKEYKSILVKMYRHVGLKSKLVDALVNLHNLWMQEKSFHKALDTIQELTRIDQSERTILCVQKFILQAVTEKAFSKEELEDNTGSFLDVLIATYHDTHLTQFLAALDGIDSDFYRFACGYIDNSKK